MLLMHICTYREHTHSNTITLTQICIHVYTCTHVQRQLSLIFSDQWISHQLGAFETTIQLPTYYIWLDTSPKTHLRVYQFLLKDEGNPGSTGTLYFTNIIKLMYICESVQL